MNENLVDQVDERLAIDCSKTPKPLGTFYARLLGWRSPLATVRAG